jgi:hypothetical protein
MHTTQHALVQNKEDKMMLWTDMINGKTRNTRNAKISPKETTTNASVGEDESQRKTQAPMTRK